MHRTGTQDDPTPRAGHLLAGHHGGQVGVQLSGGLIMSSGFLFQSPEGVIGGNTRGQRGELLDSKSMRSGVAGVDM